MTTLTVDSASRRLLRAAEAADVLAISKRKLWELTNRREIPALRIGRAVRYDPQDLEAWILRQKRQFKPFTAT